MERNKFVENTIASFVESHQGITRLLEEQGIASEENVQAILDAIGTEARFLLAGDTEMPVVLGEKELSHEDLISEYGRLDGMVDRYCRFQRNDGDKDARIERMAIFVGEKLRDLEANKPDIATGVVDALFTKVDPYSLHYYNIFLHHEQLQEYSKLIREKMEQLCGKEEEDTTTKQGSESEKKEKTPVGFAYAREICLKYETYLDAYGKALHIPKLDWSVLRDINQWLDYSAGEAVQVINAALSNHSAEDDKVRKWCEYRDRILEQRLECQTNKYIDLNPNFQAYKTLQKVFEMFNIYQKNSDGRVADDFIRRLKSSEERALSDIQRLLVKSELGNAVTNELHALHENVLSGRIERQRDEIKKLMLLYTDYYFHWRAYSEQKDDYENKLPDDETATAKEYPIYLGKFLHALRTHIVEVITDHDDSRSRKKERVGLERTNSELPKSLPTEDSRRAAYEAIRKYMDRQHPSWIAELAKDALDIDSLVLYFSDVRKLNIKAKRVNNPKFQEFHEMLEKLQFFIRLFLCNGDLHPTLRNRGKVGGKLKKLDKAITKENLSDIVNALLAFGDDK